MTEMEALHLVLAIEDLIVATMDHGIDGNPELPKARRNLMGALLPIEIPRFA